MSKFLSVLVVLTAFVSCSSPKKTELNQTMKDFLTDFQHKLEGTDDEILKLFATGQGRDEILNFVSILQNKDSVIKIRALYDEAKLNLDESSVYLDIPTDVKGKGHMDERTFFTLYLSRLPGRFVSSKIDGELLFREFFSLKSNIENEDQISQRMAELKPYYDRAKTLQVQKHYDSVVWFVNHDTCTYYYVVTGNYNFDSLKRGVHQDFKMGLVNATGKVIVPLEFDVIGNPSMVMNNSVEVIKDGKVGYFDLSGKEIIPAAYQWLVSYTKDDAAALVAKDSLNGWLDHDFHFHENFPSNDAKRNIEEFQYLVDHTFTIGHNKDLINVIYPLKEEYLHSGNGLIIPSAFLVKNGIFPQIYDGFVSSGVKGFYEYGTDFVENSNNKPFSVSETLTAFISDFRSKYIGGRTELYTTHRIVLIDPNHHVVDAVTTYGDLNFEFKQVNEQLFEAKFQHGPSDPDEILEQNFPGFNYFKFDGHKLTQLESNRRFKFTEFVKIDSSYFSGDFRTFDYEHYTSETKAGQSKFVSAETLQFIRDEILAANGYIFKNRQRSDRFKYWKWYNPKIETYDEVYSAASEIDKHNLDFIEKLIGPVVDGASS